MKHWIPAILMILMISAAAQVRWAHSATKPKIYLKKKVIAEEHEGKISYFELYRMKKGDTVWKIFVKRLLGRYEEFGLFVKAFKDSNPDIGDPSFIREGKDVRLPVRAGTLGEREEIHALIEKGEIKKYRVKKGDTLWDIVSREHGKGKGRKAYMVKIVQLNPFLKDPDKIYPRQSLYLPEKISPSPKKKRVLPARLTEKVIMSKEKKTVALPPHLDRPKEMKAEKGEAGFAYPEKVVGREEKVVSKKLDDSLAGATNVETMVSREKGIPPGTNYRGLLGDILSILGGHLIVSGNMYLPLGGGGELVLKMSNYPLARFENGKRVILDPGGSIPPDVQGIILKKWSGYSILKVDYQDPGTLISSLLKEGDFYSVREGKETNLSIGDKVTLSFDVDLIILKEKDSLLRGGIYGIRSLNNPDISDHLARIYLYAEEAGISLIPYYVDSSVSDGFVPSYSVPDKPERKVKERLPSVLIPRVTYVLDLLGIPYEKERTISIKGAEGGFTLNIKPDLTFRVGKRSFVIDPKRFSNPIKKLLRREGYSVITLRKDSKVSMQIDRLLSSAGIHHVAHKKKSIAKGEKEGYTLSVSGIFLDKVKNHLKSHILFVEGEVDSGMRSLLSDEFGVRVITY